MNKQLFEVSKNKFKVRDIVLTPGLYNGECLYGI